MRRRRTRIPPSPVRHRVPRRMRAPRRHCRRCTASVISSSWISSARTAFWTRGSGTSKLGRVREACGPRTRRRLRERLRMRRRRPPRGALRCGRTPRRAPPGAPAATIRRIDAPLDEASESSPARPLGGIGRHADEADERRGRAKGGRRTTPRDSGPQRGRGRRPRGSAGTPQQGAESAGGGGTSRSARRLPARRSRSRLGPPTRRTMIWLPSATCRPKPRGPPTLYGSVNGR